MSDAEREAEHQLEQLRLFALMLDDQPDREESWEDDDCRRPWIEIRPNPDYL